MLLLSGCGLQTPGSAADPLSVELMQQDQHRLGAETADAPAPGNSIAQSFRSNRDNLSRIEIQLKSFPSPLPTDGTFHLKAGADPDGPDLRVLPFAAADFSRNPYLAFSFTPIANSAGQPYTFVLTSPDAPLANFISAHMTTIDSYSAGSAFFDGSAQPGDLTFRTYYSYTPANLAADILTALAAYWWLMPAAVAFLLLPGLLLGRLIRPRDRATALLTAPGVTLLVWPVLLLVTHTAGLQIGPLLAWGLPLVCLALLIWCWIVAGSPLPVAGRSSSASPQWSIGASFSKGLLPLPLGERAGVRGFSARQKAKPDLKLAPLPQWGEGQGAGPMFAANQEPDTAQQANGSVVTSPTQQHSPVEEPLPTGNQGLVTQQPTTNSLPSSAPGNPVLGSRLPPPGSRVYWYSLAAVLLLTLLTRLVPLRELWAGMGLDAYHHTLVTAMFLRDDGVPADYLPYAPLASFTYHFGFHAFAAALGWLAPGALPVERLTMLAGQLTLCLPVLSLALFGWRVLGDHALGLIAGALVGLVAIFPAFYLNWSRYTQGLGLALLPVAWVVLFDALAPFFGGGRAAWRRGWPGLLLAAVCCAGDFLSHYRIFGMFAAYAALYIGGRLLTAVFARRRNAEPFRLWTRLGIPLLALAAVAGATLLLLAPWLLNLQANFTTRFAGSTDPADAGYYDINSMVGPVPLQFWSTLPLLVLAALGLAFCILRRKWASVALAVWWGALLLWSNPTAFSFRLPGAGYIDSVTVATSAFVPVCLLAAYPLAGLGRLALDLPGLAGRLLRRDWRLRFWRPVMGALLAVATAFFLIFAGQTLLPILDTKPYIGGDDIAGMAWLRANTPPAALVLGSGFGQTWGPQAVQGSDGSLWTPVLADRRSTLPPVPAYNERPVDPAYLDQAIDITSVASDALRTDISADQQAQDWAFLRADGVSYLFVGSRGGMLDPVRLLQLPDQVQQVFHQDGVWIFKMR